MRRRRRLDPARAMLPRMDPGDRGARAARSVHLSVTHSSVTRSAFPFNAGQDLKNGGRFAASAVLCVIETQSAYMRPKCSFARSMQRSLSAPGVASSHSFIAAWKSASSREVPSLTAFTSAFEESVTRPVDDAPAAAVLLLPVLPAAGVGLILVMHLACSEPSPRRLHLSNSD